MAACGGARGGTVHVDVRLTSKLSISDLQFDVVFNPAVLSFSGARAGSQALLSGKTLTRAQQAADRWRVVIGNSNNKQAIGNGIVAVLQFQIAPAAALGRTPMSLNNAQGWTPQGTGYFLADVAGTLEVLSVPTLDYLLPATGSPGTLLVVNGSNFGSCAENVRVTFTGSSNYQRSATPLEVSLKRMVVTVPADALGTLGVAASVGGIPAARQLSFVVDATLPFSGLSSEVLDTTVLGGNALPAGVAIDSRANLAFIADISNSRITVVDAETGSRIGDYPVAGGAPQSLAVNPATRRLVVTQPTGNSVTLLQIHPSGSLQNPVKINVGIRPQGVAVNAVTNRAVVANHGSGNISVLDLGGERAAATVNTSSQPLDVAMDTARNRAFVIHAGNNSVWKADLATHQAMVWIADVGSRLKTVGYHDETGVLLIGTESGLVLSRLEQNFNARLLAGESIDALSLQAGRGLIHVFSNSTGRMTTIDLLTALVDPGRAVVGAVPIGTGLVQGVAVNPWTNRGMFANLGLPRGVLEQSEGAGISRWRVPSSLNFPRLLMDSLNQVLALAVSNPGAETATLQMTALNAEGQQVQAAGVTNPATMALTANEQIARYETDEALFGEGIPKAGDCWYKLVSPNPGLKAFFLTGDERFQSSIVGADESGTLLAEAILPAVRAGSRHLVSLINPLPVASSVSLRLMGNSGEVLQTVTSSIPAFGLLQKKLEELFPEGVRQIGSGAYVRISAVPSVRAYELLVPEGKLDPAGFNAQSAVTGPSVLNFSYFAAGGGYSTLAGIVNLEASTQTVTLTLRGSDGTAVASTQAVRVPGNGRAEPELGTLFGLPSSRLMQGWLRIEGTGRLAGYLTYATGQALAAVVNLPEPRTQLTFSHVAEEGTGFFTGLALLNANPEAATVTISVYRSDGQLTVTGPSLTIGANGQRVALLNQLVGEAVKGQTGGYVIVKSTLPIHGMEIFGTASLSAMANVPAQ